tara:strand:+ start:8347 stop:8688 length:342 start_codon:yes stop_codon:yes gene_type:complete
VIDGDTVDGLIDCGFSIFVKKRIRLAKINAPETRTRNKSEKAKGLKAKKRLQELLKEHKGALRVRTELDKTGKFGRVLGTLFAIHSDSQFQQRELNINKQLLDEGLVEVYGKV